MTFVSRRICPVVAALAAACLQATSAWAGGPNNAMPPAALSIVNSTDRLIVRLREPAAGVTAATPAARIGQLGGRLGASLQRLRGMSGNAHVLQLSRMHSRAEAAELARQLAADPDVLYAEPDLRMVALRVPNDTSYSQQWHYFEPAGGINLPAAWDRTVGSADITVAVIDTGVASHPELNGRLVAGYDFITNTTTSQDGDGRDADPSDPGDFGCEGSGNSSWHGTHVAGTIGAASNNGDGVAGINWGSKIQSLRVLGRCGGYTSDVVDAMRWASGITVAGVPANPRPARVLNLSLGGGSSCGTTYQNAVNDVVARGTVVVVAAGNSNVDAAGTSPASCNGVIAVGATTRSGAKAGFSNHGAKVAVSAPGASILSTLNSGSSGPASPNYAWYSGTSMAAPHVAGVVSLMLSLNPALTPAQVVTVLKSSARAFPTGTGADCTTALCGAGIVDAAAALTASVPPPVAPPTQPRINLALPPNGGVMTASSTYDAGHPPTASNDGDRMGLRWGSGGGWTDASSGQWPDWLELDLGAVKTVAEVSVFTIQDNYSNPLEPTEAMTFALHGITSFEVQYWTGSAWQTVPGGSVTGNNRVWRRFAFAPVSTNRLRVLVLGSNGSFSRIVELEAYATAETQPLPSAINYAAQINGGVAQASTTYSSAFAPSAVNNGDRRGANWGVGGGWNDGSDSVWPDSIHLGFNGIKRISQIDVFTIQDSWATPLEPTEAMTFTQYGIISFEVQTWNGSTWITVPGGSVIGNNKVWRRFTFPVLETNAVRVLVHSAFGGYSRIAEIEAWGPETQPPPSAVNHAAQINGGVAQASTTYSSAFAPSAVNNGDRRGANWGVGGGWNDGSDSVWPDSIQLGFNGIKRISQIDVFTIQDSWATPLEPTEAMTFTQYGIISFEVQTWNGSTWITVPGGSVIGNNKVWRRFTFPVLETNAVRVLVHSAFGGYSRIAEIEAWGPQ